MKNRILRSRCVIGLIVVALIAGGFQLGTSWRQPETVRAQPGSDDDSLSSGELAILLAIGQGQKMRLTVGTIPGAREVPYLWFFTVHNTSNEVLFRSERIEVPSGEWRFSDVSREALNIAGEPGTGRAQVMVRVFVEFPRGVKASDFIGSMEVLDENTAASSTYLRFTFDRVVPKVDP